MNSLIFLFSVIWALNVFQANATTTHLITVALDEQGNWVWVAESNQKIWIDIGDTIMWEWAGSQHNLVFVDNNITYSYPSDADSNSLVVCPPTSDHSVQCSYSHTFLYSSMI